jgi:hypothetical protein
VIGFRAVDLSGEVALDVNFRRGTFFARYFIFDLIHFIDKAMFRFNGLIHTIHKIAWIQAKP